MLGLCRKFDKATLRGRLFCSATLVRMEEKNLFVRTVLGWLPFALVGTVLLGFVFMSIQQVYRAGANDPQIQIAEDVAGKLSAGADMRDVIPAGTVAIELSSASYVIVYNSVGFAVGGNGSLHGNVPVLPEGVLEVARQNGEHRLTWQPEEGIRQATVIVPYKSDSSAGFVMVGRSLQEVEQRITDLMLMTGLALVILLIGAFATVFLKEWLAH